MVIVRIFQQKRMSHAHQRSFYIKVEVSMKRGKGGIVLGSCPNCLKAFSFVEKFHLSHTKMMMCPSCRHQIKETFVSKMSFFMICLIPLLVMLIQLKGASPMLKWPILLGWILLNFYVLQPIIHRYELTSRR